MHKATGQRGSYLAGVSVLLLVSLGTGAGAASPPPPALPPEPGRVIAEWPGGTLTAGELQAELDRVAPQFRDSYDGWRVELVNALAIVQQLDRSARSRRLAGENALERVRALIGAPPPTASDDELRAHATRFRELLARSTAPAKIVDPAALRAVQPSLDANAFHENPGWPTRPFHLLIDGDEELTGETFAGGAFLGGGRLISDLGPLQWLYLDLFWGGRGRLSDGVWVPYEPPKGVLAASSSFSWKTFPPGAPVGDGLLERYQVNLRAPTREGELEERDARILLERISLPLRLCIARTAWDHRWRAGAVSFSMQISGGLVGLVSAKVDVADSVPISEWGAFVIMHPVERCRLLLSRWRSPRRLDGKLSFRADYAGEPWSDAEQELNFTGKVTAPKALPPQTVDIPAVNAPGIDLEKMAEVGTVTVRISAAGSADAVVEQVRPLVPAIARCSLVWLSREDGFVRKAPGTEMVITGELTATGFRIVDDPIHSAPTLRCIEKPLGRLTSAAKGLTRVSVIVRRGSPSPR